MALRWKDQHLLCGNSEQFRYFNFELDCLENENLFQKTEVWIFSYGVLVESTKIQNTSLPYKTAISEANVNTNKIVSSKPITKNKVSPVTALLFHNLRTCYKELIWYINHPNARVRTFCKRWSFIWRDFFPVNILLTLTMFNRFS